MSYDSSCQTNIFYHGTSPNKWAEIQSEGVLWGKRNAPSRCTYLATDYEEAGQYGTVILEVEYDPTDDCWVNNYFPDEWQHREYKPIPLELITVKENDEKCHK